MSDNEKAKRPESRPVFPNITPSSMTWSEIYHIEESDISTEEDLRDLLQFMYEYSEREFHLFTPQGQSVNALILGAERAGIVKFDGMEFHYYKRPDYERSYFRIQESDAQFDWQRDLLKSPMYRQTKLSLTEKGRRQFQLREIREEMERATTKKPEAQPEKWSYAYFKKLYSDHEALWWVVALVIGLIAAVLIG